ncbi:MAG: hypothetical protein KAG53_01575 [Endozoicomonadaceae bacterium]|nr:hypothetical protein [Endozoicomonadaceae bacterium]
MTVFSILEFVKASVPMSAFILWCEEGARDAQNVIHAKRNDVCFTERGIEQ